LSELALSLIRGSGALGVVAAGTLIGFSLARRLEDDLREMERLESLLLGLRSEISYALVPLPQALRKHGTRVGGTVGAVALRMGDLSGLERRTTLPEAAALALDEAAGSGGGTLPAFHAALLSDLARVLGTTGHREQAAHLDHALETAQNHRRSVEDDFRKRARLYRYLGVLSSVSIVIVML
jgi:stage III sporulation protein AB